MALAITDSNFEELVASGKPVVVDFWATWCGPCKKIGPDIEALATEYEGQAIVGKCDVEENDGLAMRFGVRNVPTVLFIKNGEVVDKQVGAAPKKYVRKQIEGNSLILIFMDSLEQELLQDAEDDARTVEFIKNYLPQEIKDKFTDEELYYFLDVIVEYYANSGILDSAPDKDGYIEIDQDKVVDFVIKQARKDKMGEFDAEDILWVVQGEMEYGESLEEEE